MSVIVKDDGFRSDDWTGGYATGTEPGQRFAAIDLPSDSTLDTGSDRLLAAPMIRIEFPDFADGRGFTLARRLRLMGFTGRLRAAGHVIADQYAMARRAGFDEVEISDELAARQPEEQWLFRARTWRDHDYQSRLRAG